MKINFDKMIEEDLLPHLTQRTCKILSNQKNKLLKINWHSGESNVDTEFSNLSKQCCLEAFKNINNNKEIKLNVDIPDLILTFKFKNKILVKKIELKSTKSKNGKTLGSMIRSLDPNMWTIICHRNVKEKKFEIRYGRYFLGIELSSRELFQDRTPRPNLDFYKFQKYSESPKKNKTKKISFNDWNKYYVDAALNRILNPKNHSWQDELVKEIIKKILKNPNKFKNI